MPWRINKLTKMTYTLPIDLSIRQGKSEQKFKKKKYEILLFRIYWSYSLQTTTLLKKCSNHNKFSYRWETFLENSSFVIDRTIWPQKNFTTFNSSLLSIYIYMEYFVSNNRSLSLYCNTIFKKIHVWIEFSELNL